MSSSSDGMSYAPQGKPAPVCKPGDFIFAAAHLDHGHIYGQCNGLIEAGGTLRSVYDPDPEKVAAFVKKYPGVKPAASLEEILDDPAIQLVAAAAVPNERGPLGVRVMEAGKDYFTDKTPFTTSEQLGEARAAVARTGRKYLVYFSERLHVECAVFAGDLIAEGADRAGAAGDRARAAPAECADTAGRGSLSGRNTAGFFATSEATRSSSFSFSPARGTRR